MGVWDALDRTRLSHAYILSAPTREETLSMAQVLAKTALCETPGKAPCGVCRHCRKVEQGIHPDVVFVRCLVDDKGKEKREILIDQIRQLVAEADVLPNEAQRKLFVIDQAHKMNAAAQNAALKLLEEPPPRLILAMCTDNAQSLLPTVRSRCVELNGSRESRQETESEKQALAYLKCVSKQNEWELLRFCMGCEGMDQASLQDFLQALRLCATDMLCFRRDSAGLSRQQLLSLCGLADRCSDYLKVNTGIKHVLGLLAVSAAGNDKEGTDN